MHLFIVLYHKNLYTSIRFLHCFALSISSYFVLPLISPIIAQGPVFTLTIPCDITEK